MATLAGMPLFGPDVWGFGGETSAGSTQGAARGLGVMTLPCLFACCVLVFVGGVRRELWMCDLSLVCYQRFAVNQCNTAQPRVRFEVRRLAPRTNLTRHQPARPTRPLPQQSSVPDHRRSLPRVQRSAWTPVATSTGPSFPHVASDGPVSVVPVPVVAVGRSRPSQTFESSRPGWPRRSRLASGAMVAGRTSDTV